MDEGADAALLQGAVDDLPELLQEGAGAFFGAVAGEDGEDAFEPVQALFEAFEEVGDGQRCAAVAAEAFEARDLFAALYEHDVDLRGVGQRVFGVEVLRADGVDVLLDFALQADEGRVVLQEAGVEADEVGVEVFGGNPQGEHFRGVEEFGAYVAAACRAQ